MKNHKKQNQVNYTHCIGIVILSLLTISSCSDNPKHNPDSSDNKVYEHSIKKEFEAIYWHQGNQYSAAIKDGDGLVIEKLPPARGGGSEVKIYTDATSVQWYECEWRSGDPDVNSVDNRMARLKANCKIHIRSIDHMKTGSWSRGKFGIGMTTRIDDSI